MKVSCDREALLKAVQGASGPTSGKVPIGLLRNVLFVATCEGHGSEVVGTNNEIGIRQRVYGVHVDEPGRILLNAERTAKILRSIASVEVALVADANEVTFTGNGSEFAMPLDNVDAFPDVPTVEGMEVDFEVPTEEFKRAIQRTVFSADDGSSSRYALSGVCFDGADSRGLMVATDGRRLSLAKLSYEVSSSLKKAVVPAKSLIELARLLGTEDTVKVAFREDSLALFASGPMLFTSRLVGGRFPHWQDILPASSPEQRISFAVADLARVVDAAAIMTSEESSSVYWTFGTGELEMSAQSEGYGRARVTLPCEVGLFRNSRLRLDSRYVSPMLKAADKDGSVTLRIYGSSEPVIFECGDWEYLVMPMVLEDKK